MEEVDYQEGISDGNLESTEENSTKTFNCETSKKVTRENITLIVMYKLNIKSMR